MPKQNHRIEVLFKKSILCVPPSPLPHCYRGDVPQGMNIKDALKEVLRNALIHDGLARGLREAVKALDKYVFYTTIDNVDCVTGIGNAVDFTPQRGFRFRCASIRNKPQGYAIAGSRTIEWIQS